MKHGTWILGAAAALLATPGSLGAQTKTGRIVGVVTDGARPLAQVTIELFGRKEPQLTGGDGAFRFDSLRSGPYWISVRRIGYAPITFATRLDGGVKEFQVELDATPYQLPEVTVQGGMTNRRYSEFHWRQRSAWGKFFTREDIARIRPVDLVGLVQQGLPWVSRWVLERPNWSDPPTAFGYVSSATRRSFMTRNCTPAISRNGTTPWPGNALTDWSLEEVEAVEVYRGSHVPIEFAGPFTSGCGLVVVWVR